jgi:hypothetical protein
MHDHTNQAITYVPVLPVDVLLHTQEHPFCPIDSCFCHRDAGRVAQVDEAVSEGLFTPEEALRCVEGRTL